MTCRLLGAMPLSEPMLVYCQLEPEEQTSMKFKHFPLKKMHLKMSSGKRRPFCLIFGPCHWYLYASLRIGELLTCWRTDPGYSMCCLEAAAHWRNRIKNFASIWFIFIVRWIMLYHLLQSLVAAMLGWDIDTFPFDWSRYFRTVTYSYMKNIKIHIFVSELSTYWG